MEWDLSAMELFLWLSVIVLLLLQDTSKIDVTLRPTSKLHSVAFTAHVFLQAVFWQQNNKRTVSGCPPENELAQAVSSRCLENVCSGK